MTRLQRRISALVFIGALSAWAPFPVTASDDDGDAEYVVIRARRVITVSGQTYRPGMVVIEDGKVRAVGQRLDVPATARIVEARRETVMPGLILPRSRHGLSRYARTGVHGKEKAADEVFLSELDFDDLLEAGYTIVAYIPDGAGIPGVASVVRTSGRNGPELIEERSYLRVSMTDPGSQKGGLRRAFISAKKEIEKVRKAREEWEKKQKEAKEKAAGEKQESEKKEPEKNGKKEPAERTRGATPPEKDEKKQTPPGSEASAETARFKPPEINPDLQPLVDLLQEKPGATVVFELSEASDLLHLDSVLEEYPQVAGYYHLSVNSRSDYSHVIDRLGERKALVMLPPVLGRLPFTVNETNLPAELARAGCQIAFVPRGDGPGEFRYTRTRVSELVRAGLTRRTALAALTLNAARVLGLEDRFGSLEKGKEADIIFLSGDPLGPERRVTRVMISGEIIWEADRE